MIQRNFVELILLLKKCSFCISCDNSSWFW